MYTATTATRKIAKLTKRIRAVAGGTSASKTISILLQLIHLSQTDKSPKLTSVVSESMPHIKKAAMRDFLDIMRKHGYYKEELWNRTDSIYTFETGSQMEFFGVDSSEKVHGPRRDRLFVNEANNVPFLAYDQLEVRTRETIWLDWNPTSEFWFYTEVLPARESDLDFITLTYKDNESLEPAIVQSIESRKPNKSWWTVYGEGKLGEVEGKVYTNWAIIDEIPHEARLERYGLDFGYTNDPTAIVAIYYYNGGYILDEIVYQKGLSNKQIADIFSNLEKVLVIADSAEPKSIDELKSYGLMVMPVVKGSDSVNQGIQRLQSQRVSITKTSINGIKEYRNYMWQTDREGKIINTPTDYMNHFLDAARYGFDGILSNPYEKIVLPEPELLFAKTGY
jgi:phage terminase large subunit